MRQSNKNNVTTMTMEVVEIVDLGVNLWIVQEKNKGVEWFETLSMSLVNSEKKITRGREKKEGVTKENKQRLPERERKS